MAFLTIVIQTSSDTVQQLNQRQSGASNVKNEFNHLLDYIGGCAGGNQVLTSFYVVTNNSDPAVATDGGSSTKIVYNL